jgi:hypothetical protein
LARAEATWRTAETERLAALEAKWREAAKLAAADAGAEARARSDQELRSLREECAAMRARLRERDAEFAQTRATSEEAREAAKHESHSALARAKETWKAEEAARMAAAEAQWKKRYSRQLADATARAESAETALAQLRHKRDTARDSDYAEMRRLRDELLAAQAALARRDQPQAQWSPAPAHAEAPQKLDPETTLIFSFCVRTAPGRSPRAWNSSAAPRRGGAPSRAPASSRPQCSPGSCSTRRSRRFCRAICRQTSKPRRRR